MIRYDKERYAHSLSQMIRIATISHSEDEPTDGIPQMHEWLRERYPLIAHMGEWHDMNGGLLIRIRGTDPEQKPLCLMSHMDVAPVAGQTWKRGPFSGEIADGCIYGRGAADTKGSLCAIFESVEALLSDGFMPRKDVYILSSSREEVAGEDAVRMAEYFRAQRVTPSLVIDEGGAVMPAPMQGVEGDFAMIAMSERSSARLLLRGDREKIEKANRRLLSALKKGKLAPSAFPDEVEEMFRRMQPHMHGLLKFIFRRFEFFKPLLLRLIPALNAQAAAMVLPSAGFVRKDNEDCVTLKCTYHHNIDRVCDNAVAIYRKYGIDASVTEKRPAPVPIDFRAPQIALVEQAVRASMPQVHPVPFIIFGGTDARHFVGLSDCVARFAPLKMNYEIVNSVHQADEYIFIDSLESAVKFYVELIRLFDAQ